MIDKMSCGVDSAPWKGALSWWVRIPPSCRSGTAPPPDPTFLCVGHPTAPVAESANVEVPPYFRHRAHPAIRPPAAPRELGVPTNLPGAAMYDIFLCSAVARLGAEPGVAGLQGR